MDQPMSGLSFRVMSLLFVIRDSFKPRKAVLMEVGLEPGFNVLEFGCGPGSYTTIAGDMVGKTGKVYALDIHPLAIRSVQKRVSDKGLTNVETILSDGATGLEDGSIDVVLMYDVFHDLGDQNGVLKEMHRILKSGATLSFSDHHLKDNDVISKLTETGLFKFSKKDKTTFTFIKEGQQKTG